MGTTTVTVQGVEVPALGFGTWRLRGEECVEGVRSALELGYRHVDTATSYGNETDVGEGIRRAGVDRGEIFLTSKLAGDEVAPQAVGRAATASLRRLGTDYLDLLLIHWPSKTVPLNATLEAMLALVDRGLVRHLGVSNFPRRLLDDALGMAPILANQVEYHPYLDQRPLLELCRERDVLLTAYAPTARGRVLDDPVLVDIAAAHGKSPVQVALRWLLDQDHVAVIPKSRRAELRAANADVFDFALSDAERERVDQLRERRRRFVDPPDGPEWDT